MCVFVIRWQPEFLLIPDICNYQVSTCTSFTGSRRDKAAKSRRSLHDTNVSRLWEKEENLLQKLQLPVRISGTQRYSRSEKYLDQIQIWRVPGNNRVRTQVSMDRLKRKVVDAKNLARMPMGISLPALPNDGLTPIGVRNLKSRYH